MPSSADRRRAPRIPVKIPAIVHLKLKNQEVEAEVLDISEGGAFIHCTVPIRLGEEITLKIQYEKTEVIDGRIVELEKLSSDQLPKTAVERSIVKWVRGSAQSGFGVQFVSLDKAKLDFVSRLRKYLREHK